ncbi:MAG: hypothetical protein MJ182_00215 [Treponema sp.]|nr:hypothetical protein [Treponema sp.]
MKKLILVIITLCNFFLFAQNFPTDYVSRIWTAADGLPGNTVTDIIQNEGSYIYLGTYDGLVRFDGFEFTILNKNTIEDFNCVSARVVFEDSKGILWIGSNDEGVARIEGNTITTYTKENGLPNNSIRDIVEDNAGNIWIGTAAGIVYITPENKFISPKGLSEIPDEHILVTNLYCDTAGRIWLNTSKKGGIYFYASEKFSHYSTLNQFSNHTISAVGQTSTGDLVFGISNNGAVIVKNGQIEYFPEDSAFQVSTPNEIYRDKSGNLWFATDKGVFLFKGNSFAHYSVNEGLTDNNVNHILEDREGNIWFATDRGGVEKMSLGKFHTQNLSAGVNSICEASNGIIWVGTDDGLMCFKDGTDISNEYELCSMTKGIRIRHVAMAQNGDLLVSCYSEYGQIRKTENGYINWTSEDGLSGDKIRVCLEDNEKNLWIGTTTGLSLISHEGDIIDFSHTNELSNNYIMCIFQDHKNNIWIGTDGGGIDVINNGKIISSYNTQQGLSGNVVFKIWEDEKNNIWICTGTGISKFNGKSFENYNAQSGLGTDSAFQILVDYTGTAWMTSNRGISSLPFEDFNRLSRNEIKMIDPRFYTKNDGLKTGGVTSTSLSMRDSIGRLYFTLIDGFAIYDPLKISSNKILPDIHLESAIVDNVKINISDGGSLVLAPGVKRIELNYTGLSFVSPELVRFRHKLDGFDKDYSVLSNHRNVSYTNLKPGTYTFNVIAANSDGLWNETPATFTLKIKPFFYQVTWFWILVALIIATVIIIIVKVREKRLMVRQLKLETMIQMKTVDLEIEKDNSDRLLKNILPDSIAARLKENQFGDQTIADKFDDVTVLFADIVGFTKTTSNHTADEIVAALNTLFTRFDLRAKQMGVEKIKTIGDAYMAVCGLPNPVQNHAAIMIKFAKGMYKDLAEYNKTAKIKFQIRIGINCGPVVAGVIGKTKFIYDLWGDTVNIASRMESICTPGHIMITESVKAHLSSQITIDNENEYDVKGKGKMKAISL